jgi:GDPmannose 4,6-dehydratase
VKKAIVTGVTGQDGSILAEKLLEQGYKVYGLFRRSSSCSLGNAQHLQYDIELLPMDLIDFSSILRSVCLIKPDLFFNTAAQSHVARSFEEPIHTAQVTGIGVLNCLESLRQGSKKTRFVQFSSSEMYGGLYGENLIDESTPFHPRSPYASAKCFGYHTTVNYREAYDMFASNAICFNHEEPGKRSPNFVTRKIAIGVVNIKKGYQDTLRLGNIHAKRDWGLATDYCNGVIQLIEHDQPDDIIFATGETYSVVEFLDIAFKHVGIPAWESKVIIDSNLFRPSEVNVLIGDSSKAKKVLGWEPVCKFEHLVKKMVDFELDKNEG